MPRWSPAFRLCISKVGSGRKWTTETRRTPDIRDRMTAARIGKWNRISRISRMNSASASACRHRVDPVHPVKSSSSFGKVAKVIGELQCSVSPCLPGQYLPTFVTHTRSPVGGLRDPETVDDLTGGGSARRVPAPCLWQFLRVKPTLPQLPEIRRKRVFPSRRGQFPTD